MQYMFPKAVQNIQTNAGMLALRCTALQPSVKIDFHT